MHIVGIVFFLESILQLKQRERELSDCIVLSVVQIHKVKFSARPSSDHMLALGAQNMQSTAIASA